MTNCKRISVSLTPEMERKVMEIRKTDEYCRSSVAEILRMLIERGLSAERQNAAERRCKGNMTETLNDVQAISGTC